MVNQLFKIIYTTALFAVVSFSTIAQTEDDIVRFSKLGFTGSARFTGMGGAMGALGADFSSVSINPAGLARSSKSIFSFTPSIDMSNSIGVFNNNETRESDANLGLPEISLIRHFTETSGGWNSFQVAIGYTRFNNFNNMIKYEGVANNSILHDFAESAYGTDFNYDPNNPNSIYNARPFTSALAYDTYAIDPLMDEDFNVIYDDQGNISYVSQIPYGAEVNQSRTVSRIGHHGEFNFAVSGNYQNKLYVGASLGIQRIKFEENWTHTEQVVDTAALFIQSLEYRYNLFIRGVGVNLKVGAIYLPKDWLRVGLALHTPTRFNMNDSWRAGMSTQFFDQSYAIEGADEPTGSFEYVMRTPFRATASAAFLLNKRGILSLDVDYVDYRTGAFKPKRGDEFTDYTSTNFDINERLTNAFNIRAGADIRIIGNFSWRFGMGYYGTPYNKELIFNNPNRHYVTTGFGLRFEKFSFDLGYMLHRSSEDYFAYFTEQDGPSVANFKNRQSVINLSFGFRF